MNIEDRFSRIRDFVIEKLQPQASDKNDQILIGLTALILFFAVGWVIYEELWIFQKPSVLIGFSVFTFFLAFSAQALKFVRLGLDLSQPAKRAWERVETLLSIAALMFGLPLFARFF